MKTQPIRPASSGAEAAPGGATAGGPVLPPEAWLQGVGLPARWARQARFVLLDTGFAGGHHFLATWQAWRDDPERCERLVYVALEDRPPRRADLLRAHQAGSWPNLAAQLAACWPPLTPNLHSLDFEAGQVQLLLALGVPGQMLPAMQLQVDACYLAGAAPDLRLLKSLARKAAPHATLVAAGADPALLAGLRSSGFVLAGATGPGASAPHTSARHAPAFKPRGKAPRSSAPRPRSALVVGAGVAGAAAAQGLAQQGLQVTVLDRLPGAAGAASGNQAALVHGTVNPDDGPYARLFRAAALEAQRCYQDAARQQPGLAAMAGLLRLELDVGAAPAMRALLSRLGLPADYVQVLDTAAAAALAGVPLPAPAWHYAGGGWVRPAAWVQQVLARPGIRFESGCEVHRITDAQGRWSAWADDGTALAEADVLVLACTAQTPRLLAPWMPEAWPLSATQGQVTLGQAGPAAALRLPVAGDGYALPLPWGDVLCGATRHEAPLADWDRPLALRDDDHRHNLERLLRLTGLQLQGPLQGRGAWRLHSDDRLPIAGAVPQRQGPAGSRQDQARWWPRVAGLFVLTGLGARGLTLAPLLGRLVAAQACGAPWPLEQDLADAVDPVRWRVRAARRAAGADKAPA